MASKNQKKIVAKGKGKAAPKILNPISLPSDLPSEKLAANTQPLGFKKWALKDTPVFHPIIEKWVEKDNIRTPVPAEEQSAYPLKRNTIVDILPQDASITWSGIAFTKTIYEVVDPKTLKKDWVTTKVVGWVSNEYLDDYIEEFPGDEVNIPRKTKSSIDLEQNMTIEDEGYDETRARYNMCGQLSVAYIAKEEFDPQSSIDDVLEKWKHSGVKNKEGFNVNYIKLVGKGRDETLVAKDVKEILNLYYTDDLSGKIEPYVVGTKKIPLSNLANDTSDDRHASSEFQDRLLKYYFITLVTINPNTGELIPNPDPKKRNHWIVVDRISHNGVRVEIYNPSPNKRQSYSFREFFNSVGSNPNTGWWVERKQPQVKKEADVSPKPEVEIENPTPDEKDAEQYILVENLKKVNLCGEFSVAYILKNSLDQGLKNWMGVQESLRRQGQEPAGLWELATVIQAFGMNRAGLSVVKPYSIDTILKFWKTIQPDLYGSILGGANNETTGPMDLITILKAYGYSKGDDKKGDDYWLGSLPLSPGAGADRLKREYYIAGVRIDTKKNGRLKNKLGDGVDHWVVLTEIKPVETLVGGNGGWVWLYNSFTNVLEEYSYKEFMEAYSGAGLWVTREVNPAFMWQAPEPAITKSKKNKTNSKAAPKISADMLRREIRKQRDQGTASLNSIAKALSNPKLGFGWSNQEILKFLKNPEADHTRMSLAEVERKLREELKVGSIAREVSRWIRDTVNDTVSFILALTNLLRDFGILVIENVDTGRIVPPEELNIPPGDKKAYEKKVAERRARLIRLEDMNLSEDKDLSQVLRFAFADRFDDSDPVSRLKKRITGIFIEQVVDQLQKIPPIIHAYKAWPDYKRWQKTITVPKSNIYRVREWGDNVMGPLGFDTKKVGTGNFQAVGLYNRVTEFGAVKNYVHIPRRDIDRLIDLQFDEIVNGKKMFVEDKMNWLCQPLGRIYMFDSGKDSWQSSMQIRWGTIALGGNLVQVVDEDQIAVKLPGEKHGKAVKRRMMRLAGFKPSDWSRPMDELLAEGLMHRCFVANDGNVFADTSRGIVYSPFFDVSEWSFNNGTGKPDALYIPFEYLEPRTKPEAESVEELRN